MIANWQLLYLHGDLLLMTWCRGKPSESRSTSSSWTTVSAEVSERTHLLKKPPKEEGYGFFLLYTLGRRSRFYFLRGALCLLLHDAIMFAVPQVLRWEEEKLDLYYSRDEGHQAESKTCCGCLQLFVGLHEGPSCWDLEGLPACLAALPAVVPAVTPSSPLHVSLLHGWDEAEDCHHGPGLQEGEFLSSIFCCSFKDTGGSTGCYSSFGHSNQLPESSVWNWCVLSYSLWAYYQCQQKVGLAWPREARIWIRLDFCRVSLMLRVG